MLRSTVLHRFINFFTFHISIVNMNTIFNVYIFTVFCFCFLPRLPLNPLHIICWIRRIISRRTKYSLWFNQHLCEDLHRDHEESLLPGLLASDSRTATFVTPPRVTCPQWVWIPYINQKPRKCYTDMSTDQSDGSSSSVKVPSIQTTPVCVRLAITDQHSILTTQFNANRHCHKPEKEWRPQNSGNSQRRQELPSYTELS